MAAVNKDMGGCHHRTFSNFHLSDNVTLLYCSLCTNIAGIREMVFAGFVIEEGQNPLYYRKRVFHPTPPFATPPRHHPVPDFGHLLGGHPLSISSEEF
jgi:hypothetical protein